MKFKIITFKPQGKWYGEEEIEIDMEYKKTYINDYDAKRINKTRQLIYKAIEEEYGDEYIVFVEDEDYDIIGFPLLYVPKGYRG